MKPGSTSRGIPVDLARSALDLQKRLVTLKQLSGLLDEADYLSASPLSKVLLEIEASARECLRHIESASLPELHAYVEERALDERLNYGKAFTEALESSGLTYSGAWPAFSIATYLKVELDLKALQVTVNGDRVKLSTAAKVVEFLKRLLGEIDAEAAQVEFVPQMEQAYAEVAG